MKDKTLPTGAAAISKAIRDALDTDDIAEAASKMSSACSQLVAAQESGAITPEEGADLEKALKGAVMQQTMDLKKAFEDLQNEA